MKKIIIVGGGGNALNLLDILEQNVDYHIEGIIDSESKGSSSYYGHPYIGTDEDLQEIYQSGITEAAVGVGFMGQLNMRKQLFILLKKIGYVLPALIDSSAIISKRALIEEGTFVGKGAVVNAAAIVKEGTIINSGAVIEHGTVIGKYSHISVNASICGDCLIGDDSFVGANSVVRQGVQIGDHCLIGAGSVVLKNIPSNITAFGNPCKERV